MYFFATFFKKSKISPFCTKTKTMIAITLANIFDFQMRLKKSLHIFKRWERRFYRVIFVILEKSPFSTISGLQFANVLYKITFR